MTTDRRSSILSRAAPAAVLVVILSCCGRVPQADRLLTDAVDASTTLATYYDTLMSVTLDGWENQGVYNALLEIAAPNGEQYEERLLAFRRRAEVAHTLVLVYQRLEILRDPKGLGSVTSAGQALGEAIKGIPNLPGGATVPSDQLGTAAATIANLQRDHDFKRALGALGTITTGLRTIFEAEERTYTSVQADRADTATSLLKALAKRKLTNPGSLLPSLHLGLTIDAPTDDAGKAAGLAIAVISAERQKLAWTCATVQTRLLLNALDTITTAINKGATVSLLDLENATSHATACLTEHDALAKAKP